MAHRASGGTNRIAQAVKRTQTEFRGFPVEDPAQAVAFWRRPGGGPAQAPGAVALEDSLSALRLS